MYQHTFACPLGNLLLIATDTHLTGAFFTGQKTIPVNARGMLPGADVAVAMPEASSASTVKE